jgi:hypothetical protein
MQKHFTTVNHLITAKRNTIEVEETRQHEDIIFKHMDPEVRYHSYIQEIDEDIIPTMPEINYNQPPPTRICIEIPQEQLIGADLKDPILQAPEDRVSEEDSLQIIKFLQELEEFDQTLHLNHKK